MLPRRELHEVAILTLRLPDHVNELECTHVDNEEIKQPPIQIKPYQIRQQELKEKVRAYITYRLYKLLQPRFIKFSANEKPVDLDQEFQKYLAKETDIKELPETNLELARLAREVNEYYLKETDVKELPETKQKLAKLSAPEEEDTKPQPTSKLKLPSLYYFKSAASSVTNAVYYSAAYVPTLFSILKPKPKTDLVKLEILPSASGVGVDVVISLTAAQSAKKVT